MVVSELAAVNAVIALSFFTIAGLVVAGILKERRAGISPLGVATALIFTTCAAGHAVHAEHYLLSPGSFILDEGLRHQLIVDALTVIPAAFYLAQRRRYGLVIRASDSLLDYQRKLSVSDALRRAGDDLASQTDLEALLRAAAQHGRALLRADYAVAAANDHSGNLRWATVGIAVDWDEQTARAASCLAEVTASGGLVSLHAPQYRANLAAQSSSLEGCASHLAQGARATLTIPIARGAETLGSLVAAYRSRHTPSKDDLSCIAALAGQVAMSVENTRLIEGLREAERLKDEFLSAAAHELKTPVTTIRGHTELWLRDKTRDEQERASMESVFRQTERIARLTRDLLAAVRFRSGAVALRRKRFDLAAMTHELVDRMGRVTKSANFSVHAQPDIYVEADAELVGEVLSRLLENAIRYSPEGAPVAVTVQSFADEAVVAVRDPGVGIPLERQPHVFEPFYEPVPSGDPGYVGLVSLGLFVSKQVIVAHGGRIWAASDPGQGSTFSFSLPLRWQK